MVLKSEPSDSTHSSTVVIDTDGLDETEINVTVKEDKKIDSVNVTINDVVTPTIPI